MAGLLATIAAAPAHAQFEDVSTVRLATQLERPVAASSPPGDQTRLFVAEQHTGRIKIFNRVSGTLDHAKPFLTVANLATDNEQGLLGLAFHPNYAANGLFYTNKTRSNGDTQIEEYQVSAKPNVALASAREVLVIFQPQTNHNGGWLGFGPDGFLYVTVGDGGGGNDDDNGHTSGIGNAQDISNNLLGKMLRIDVNGDSAGAYGIPVSNPFVGVTGDDEIWAYGLRHPWRASFDRATGDLYIGDVGQATIEEIDFQPANSMGGENYGWRLREGTIATPTGGVGGPAPLGAIDPIHFYDHTQGNIAVIGGYVHRGSVAALLGRYFFADAGSGRIWSLTFDGSTPGEFNGANFTDFREWTSDFTPDVGSIDVVSSFAEDADANLYVLDLGNPFNADETDGELFVVVPELGAASAHGMALVLLAGLGRRRATGRY